MNQHTQYAGHSLLDRRFDHAAQNVGVVKGHPGIGLHVDVHEESQVALEKELETFKSKLLELKAEHEGKFVLIHGDQIVDVFTSYDDAIKAGCSHFGLSPFLVKQIHALEQVQFVSRFVDPCAAAPPRAGRLLTSG